MRNMADNVQKCLRSVSDIKNIIKKLLILLQGAIEAWNCVHRLWFLDLDLRNSILKYRPCHLGDHLALMSSYPWKQKIAIKTVQMDLRQYG